MRGERLLRTKLYRPREVSELLDLPIQSVYIWIKSGAIRANKIGGRYFIPPNEMQRLLSTRAESPKVT